jgi:glycosyltransferase involved in cell wall biosynthesis
MAELVFVLPAGAGAISGGNLYNRELIAALRELAQPVESVDLAACAAKLRAGAPGIYVVDTLDLAASRDLLPRAGQRLALLVHHLPSLEPGLLPSDPALALEAERLPAFDLWISTSTFTAAHLIARGIPEARILTIPPGVPPASPLSRSYEAPLRALLVGNLIPRKGVLEFLGLLAARLAPGDDFALDILGRDDLDPAYAQACQRLLCDPALHERVRFRGAVPYEAMAARYAAAHLVVSAAAMETYGMALAEARAHGLPLLALDRGHVASHFRAGETGFGEATLPALVDRFVSLSRDPAAMASLFASAQRERTPQRSWREVAADLVAALARV